MLFSHAVAESVETSNDSSVFPESASNYGTWDVPKTYLHLYTENKLKASSFPYGKPHFN